MRSEKRGLIISFQYFVLAIGRVAGLAIATGFALTLAPCSVHAQEFFPSGVGTETDIFGAAGSNAGGCPPGQNYGSYVSTTGPVLQGGDGVLNAKDYRQIVTEQLSSEVSQASANAGTGNLTGSVGNAATMKVAGCGEVSSGGAIAQMVGWGIIRAPRVRYQSWIHSTQDLVDLQSLLGCACASPANLGFNRIPGYR